MVGGLETVYEESSGANIGIAEDEEEPAIPAPAHRLFILVPTLASQLWKSLARAR